MDITLTELSPFAFAGAPRFHAGGVVGLKSGEVPIIAQHGEGIFTRQQMRALGPRPEVNININNLPGQRAEVQQRQDSAGNIFADVTILEEMVQGFVAKDLTSRRGKVSAAMRGWDR